MNSIRPLVTITILVVVGAYLYVKINEGPEQPEGADAWQNETLDDVPPLETVAADTAESNAAPAVAMEPAANVSGASPLAPATSDVSTNSGAAPGTLPGVPAIPDLLTGSLFIEAVYGIPGLGKFFVTSIFARDYPMIMALVLLIAGFWGLTYLVTDILYTLIDPRIRVGGSARSA